MRAAIRGFGFRSWFGAALMFGSPADARVLGTRTVVGSCAQEQFESATLAAALGDGQVNVEFDNAISGDVTPVNEELFSTYDAPSVAQAPAC